MDTVFANDLDLYIEKRQYRLVDVRSREEYERIHITGAINIPYEELESWYSKLNRNIQYILYCERGTTSLGAAREMEDHGLKTKSVLGGLAAYSGRYLTRFGE